MSENLPGQCGDLAGERRPDEARGAGGTIHIDTQGLLVRKVRREPHTKSTGRLLALRARIAERTRDGHEDIFTKIRNHALRHEEGASERLIECAHQARPAIPAIAPRRVRRERGRELPPERRTATVRLLTRLERRVRPAHLRGGSQSEVIVAACGIE